MLTRNSLTRGGKSLTLAIVIALAAFVVALTVNYNWLTMTHRIENEQSMRLLREVIETQAQAIERRLIRSLDAAYIIEIEVKRNNGLFPDFNAFSQHIIDSLGGVSNVQLAPKGIISRIYPLDGNEKAIGHDILNDDLRKEEAQLAVTERQLTLAGPFELIQGGIAVIGRNPVFIKDQFWGFVSVLIFLDDLLKATELDELAQRGYRFELIKIDQRLKGPRTFLASENPIGKIYLEANIAVPNGQWRLKLTHDAIVGSGYKPAEILFSIVFSLFIAIFVFYFYRAPERLRLLLQQKTQSLRHRNAILEQMSQGDDLSDILGEILQHIQQQINSGFSAIVIKEQSPDNTLIVSDQMPQALVLSIKKLVKDNHDFVWSTLEQHRLFTAADLYVFNDDFANFGRCAHKAKIKSMWSIPILSHQREVIAALVIMSEQLVISYDELSKEIEQQTYLINLALEQAINAKKLKKMQLAVEHSPNGVMIVNQQGVIEYANQKFTVISGYNESELIDSSPDMLSAKVKGVDQYAALLDAIMQGKEWRGEIVSRRKNGQQYVASNYIAPIESSSGEITHCVLVQEDVTEIRRISAQVAYEASHDLLTGLLNRSELERQVTALINTSKEKHAQHDINHRHAFCYIDLTQFKSVNDSVGHLAGDLLLQKISALLQQAIEPDELLARLAGDVFVIVLKNVTLDVAKQRTQRLIDIISQYRFKWQQQNISVGATAGIVAVNSESQDFTLLLKQAGTACSVAREHGRNSAHLYNADERLVALQQNFIHWASVVRDSLDHDRFTLYVQPIVPLKNSSSLLVGYEVLIRLIGEDNQIISPVKFLPAAERYNLATSIDRWVISQTLAWFQCHSHLLPDIGFVSINLSGASIGDESLMKFIIEQFNLRQIEPSKFKFEITETAAIANLTQAQQFIDRLRDFGCQFALDDFGSGLSSFAYLKNLQVTSLKIDGIFVKDINDDPINEAMVRSINEIGHVMQMTTVAEFVENEQILQRLNEIGIDYGQGYFLGKPMPIDQLLSHFEQKKLSH